MGHDGKMHQRWREFIKPWPTFTHDVYSILDGMMVSFKQNLRVINKTTNKYTAFVDGEKKRVQQAKGDSWAIRKPMHQDTVYGEVNLQLTRHISLIKALAAPQRIVNRELRELVTSKLEEKRQLKYTDKQIKEFFTKYFESHHDEWPEVRDGKVEVYYYTSETSDRFFATRKSVVGLTAKDIDAITDSGIRKIMHAHLAAEGGDASVAFSADGIDRMNANIMRLNEGHNHQPIKRVRIFEQANKFAVGHKGNKSTKFVEAAKGTNLFFAIFVNKKGERDYATIPLNVMIDCQKKFGKNWPNCIGSYLQSDEVKLMSADCTLLYLLSPGDLVYVPYEDDKPGVVNLRHVYKVVSMTGKAFHCIPASSASTIVNKMEFEAKNKMETTIDKKYSIKKVCIPIKVNRLGNLYKKEQ